jgi:outer membrane protein OmpA-like peptidoglycan-associated protein
VTRQHDMTKTVLAGLLVLCVVAVPGRGQGEALVLRFPAAAEVTASQRVLMTSLMLPVGPFVAGKIATTSVEGPLEQTAWRISAPGLSTLQLLQPLRDQVAAAGFAPVYECETEVCGGFDFRYGVALLPEPDMHVDLGDFRYLAARRAGAAGPEYISLMVSKSADDGFVQLSRIGGVAGPAPALVDASPAPVVPEPEVAVVEAPVIAGDAKTGDLVAGLSGGHSVALEDLVFASGSAVLAEGDYASLAELALWLRANPASKVALVGHTDASGGLAANIALSRKRAQSVRARLIAAFDLPSGQIAAEGVGYLAPRDNNATAEGKTRNRRVEVMITSTE